MVSFNVSFKGLLHNNPLAVSTIEGYLEGALGPDGLTFEHVDMTYCRPSEVAEKGPYDILGFDLNRECIDDFTGFLDRCPIAGLAKFVFVTGSYINCMEGGAEVVRRAMNESVPDALVIAGEPEPAVLAIVEHVKGEKPLSAVPNLYPPRDGGEQNVPADLSRISRHPYRYLDRLKEAKWHTFFVETSRGCHYGKCTFCIERRACNPGWRGYPVANVVQIFRSLYDRGVEFASVFDKDFWGGDLERAERLAEALVRADNHLTFAVRLRADEVLAGQHLLPLYKRAGLGFVYVGFESLVAPILKRYCKGTTPETNVQAASVLEENGIDFSAGSIIDPLSTLEEFAANFRAIEEHDLTGHYSNLFSTMCVWPGTRYEKILQRHTLLGEFDDTHLEYKFGYKDERVARVVTEAKSWLRETPHVNHVLMFSMRMPADYIAGHPAEHRKYFEHLRSFNQVDLGLLLDLASAVADGSGKDFHALKELRRADYAAAARRLMEALDEGNALSHDIIDYVDALW